MPETISTKHKYPSGGKQEKEEEKRKKLEPFGEFLVNSSTVIHLVVRIKNALLLTTCVPVQILIYIPCTRVAVVVVGGSRRKNKNIIKSSDGRSSPELSRLIKR